MQLKKVDFKWLNIENDCKKGGSKVQPCDAASHGLTAYKSAPYEESFEIELHNIGRHAVVQFFCCAGQWYITVYCYQVHKIKTKIN